MFLCTTYPEFDRPTGGDVLNRGFEGRHSLAEFDIGAVDQAISALEAGPVLGDRARGPIMIGKLDFGLALGGENASGDDTKDQELHWTLLGQ